MASTSAESRATRSPRLWRRRKSGLSRCRCAKEWSRSRSRNRSVARPASKDPANIAAAPTTAATTHQPAGLQNAAKPESVSPSMMSLNIHTAAVSAAAATTMSAAAAPRMARSGLVSGQKRARSRCMSWRAARAAPAIEVGPSAS